MRDPNRTQVRPDLEGLESRNLLTTGVTASLSRGVLSIVGTTASEVISVDIQASRTRRNVLGTVSIEDVATFQAAQVKKIVIRGVVGEAIQVHRLGTWNPPVQVLKPRRPIRVVPPVIPTPPVVTPPPIVTPPPVPATPSAVELAIVDAVNQQRSQFGLAPLKVSSRLVKAAQIHAADMARLNTMAHDLPGAAQPGLTDRASFVGYNFRSLGENIAEGYPDVSSVMNGWMNSPGHRSNILGAGYTEIGVGVAYASNGDPYYCQVFGNPTA